MSKLRPDGDRSEQRPDSPGRLASLGAARRRLAVRLAVLGDPRQLWWDVLDALETRRSLRIKLYLGLASVAALGIAAVFAYPAWREWRAISVARQWTAAGKLGLAGPAVQTALAEAPRNPDAWQVAADYEQRAGQPARAAEFARRAVRLAPDRVEAALAWASYALAAGQNQSAGEALARVPAAFRESSAWAQRLAGEFARRSGDAAAARAAFEAAWRIGGAAAENELPLGLVLLMAEAPADRERGVALLERWVGDPAAGADALRPLLEDATRRDDRPQMVRRAQALAAHPAHTREDVLNGLLALHRADAAAFRAGLAEAQRAFAADPAAVAVLLTRMTGMLWLAEARSWVETLPPALTGVPPVVTQVAELHRIERDWAALRRLAEGTGWTERLEFLRRAYAALAAEELGEPVRAAALWQSLRASAEIRGGQGFFLAGVLYTWGRRAEAVELWWLGAEQGGLAVQALGALARHYQVAGDAEGSRNVFRRLRGLRPNDDDVANNYVYFEALVDRPGRATRELAQAVHERHPRDVRYRATLGFVLLRAGDAAGALALLAPVADELGRLPGPTFTYGLVLAANGRAAEARTLLATVDAARLMPPERALLNEARGP